MFGNKKLVKIFVFSDTKAANIKVKVTQRSHHFMTPRSNEGHGNGNIPKVKVIVKGQGHNDIDL